MNKSTLFPASPTCQRYLNGLIGIEIGGSAHNHSGLDPQPINVDYTDQPTSFKHEEIKLVGWSLPVDVVADMGVLPFEDKSYDYVFSSHVLEHAFDPIGVLYEWERVARKYIAIILPHSDITFDRGRKYTTLSDCMERNEFADDCRQQEKITGDYNIKQFAIQNKHFEEAPNDHYNVWVPSYFQYFIDDGPFPNFSIEVVLSPDDKARNGFLVILKIIP